MSTNRRMNKQTGIFIQKDTTEQLRKKNYRYIERKKSYVERNTLCREKEVFCKSIYCTIPFAWSSGVGETNLLGRISEHKFSLERWGGGLPGKGMRELAGIIVIFCILMVVWVTQVFAFTKTHQIVPLGFTNFMLGNFYLKRKKIVLNKYQTPINNK